jgi:hypothetical protein
MHVQYLVIMLLILVILMFIFKLWVFSNKAKAKKHTVLDLILIITAFALLTYSYYTVYLGKKEHFADTSNTSALNKILSIIGIQNAVNTTADIQRVADNIAALNSDYNESLTQIQNGLTVYYSTFSKMSFPKSSRTWYNISPFFSTPDNSCPDVRIEDTHAMFTQIPNYSRETGFTIGSTAIQGPQSHQLGITGNGSFSVFFALKFSVLNQDAKVPYELVKLYANTPNNNGLSISIPSRNVAHVGNSYGINLEVTLGTQVFTASDPTTNQALLMLNTSFTYLFILVKDNLQLSLYMYPNIDNLSTNPQARFTLINKAAVNPSQDDILLSNRAMMFNRNQNVFGNLYSLGFYNKPLDDSHISMLFLHLQTEIHKSNQLLKDLASQIQLLQTQIDDAKACKYNAAVCEACKDVKDWTNISSIILGGSDECLGQIDSYCTANPKSELCTCWDSSNSLSKTTQCQNYVNIFRKNKVFSPDNVDKDTLDIIKSKNGLCSCSELETLKDLIRSNITQNVTATKEFERKRRPPLISENIYTINQKDIEYFEKMGVNDYFMGSKKAKEIPADYIVDNPFT